MIFSETRQFNKLNADSHKIYKGLSKLDISQYTTSLWNNYNDNLAKRLLPKTPMNFLSDVEISGTMFVNAGGDWMTDQLNLLEQCFDKDHLKNILKENKVGKPDIKNKKYSTSHNSIHHLYHIARYQAETKKSLLAKSSVIEWGGGYGNLAKLWLRLNPFNTTYTIIDTPLFIVLQYSYLGAIFGKEKINLISHKNKKIIENKINLLPVGLIDSKQLECDTFVSTWALSESSVFSKNYVSKKKYFGAKNILMAYQDSSDELPDASRIEELIKKAGGSVFEIPFLPGSHYAFL
jgi:hypothetical protein